MESVWSECFGALLPSVLALIGSAFTVFELGKKLKLKSPLVAAVLFSSTIGSMTYGSTAQMEIWIVFFYLLAWLAVLHAEIYLAYILVGLMALVKGPLYPVLWTMSYLVWDLKKIKTRKFWVALILGTAIGLSWYFLAAMTNKTEMLNQFLYSENFAKIHTQQGTIFQLWSEFIISLFPWILILIFGVFRESNRERWKKNQKFYLSYALLSMIFFTFFPYRVNSYLYFLTPIAAMMASEVELEFSKRKWVAFLYGVIFSILLFVVLRFCQSGWFGYELWIGVLGVSVVFLVANFKGWMSYVAIASLLLVNMIRISGVQIGEKDIAGLREIVHHHPGEYSYFINSRDYWHEFGLISAGLGKSVQRIYKVEEIDSFLAQGGFVILAEDQSINKMDQLKCFNWNRLKRRTKFPFEKLLKENVTFGEQEITRTYKVCTSSQ